MVCGRYGLRMPWKELPAGHYLSCPIDLSPDAGGQTRALLMRNRIFVSEAGIRPTIATFNARTDLPERRATLLERGLLLPEIRTVNIYDHYRNNPWGDGDAGGTGTGAPLPDLTAYKSDEEFFPDGTPFRVTYRSSTLERRIYDYKRADGSTYLRIPQFVFKAPSTWPKAIQRVNPDGTVSGEFRGVAQFFKRFVRETVGDERTFLFIDTRFNAQQLIPMRAPNIHIVYVLHNIHMAAPRIWSSDFSDIYERLLGLVDGVDAFVTLTQRQQDDIAMRRGRSSNLFVVPNPVDMPDRDPALPGRNPHRITIVARLEKQKRLGHAIRAFARAAQQVPEARLEIFGQGSQMPVLKDIAHRHGVSDAVTLHGHDPRARDALWTSSAFLMTSLFEGYPLSTLESLSHGCPVISYDIKYGPREQITDGVDGFLVPNGAIKPMAERIVQVLTSPELVEKMSGAALEKARHHGHGRFLDDWRGVLERAVELKPLRTRVEDIQLEVNRLSVTGRRGRRGASFAPTRVRRDGRVRFRGVLHVRGRSPKSTLESAELSLAAVHFPTGRCVQLPMAVSFRPSASNTDAFKVSSSFSMADVFKDGDDFEGMHLRFRFVWQNSTWDTFVGRPSPRPPGVEVSYREDVLELSVR